MIQDHFQIKTQKLLKKHTFQRKTLSWLHCSPAKDKKNFEIPSQKKLGKNPAETTYPPKDGQI